MGRFGWAGVVRVFAATGLIALVAGAALDEAHAQRPMVNGAGREVSVQRPALKPVRPGVGGIGTRIVIDKPLHCPRGTVPRKGRCIRVADCPPGQAMSRGHCCPKGAHWTGRTCGTRDAAVCPPGTKGRPPRCRPVPPEHGGGPDIVIERPLDCPKGAVRRGRRCIEVADCPPGQAMSGGHCCPKGSHWTGRFCGTREVTVCPPGTKGRPPRCRPVHPDFDDIKPAGDRPHPDTPRPPHHRPPVIVDVTPPLPPRVTDVPPVRMPPPPSSSDTGALPPSTPPADQAASTADAQGPLFRPAEVVVMVRAAEPDGTAAQLARAFNLNLRETVSLRLLAGARIYRFTIPDNRSVTGLAAAMAGTPGVAMAIPNYYHRLQGEAARPQMAGDSAQYALPKLHVPDARALVSGRGITVAVIDSGVDAAHPALRHANLTLIDAVEEGGGAPVPDKHGTAIAGIIAAQGGQVAGIAPGAKVLAVRAFAPEKEGGPPVTTSMRLARAVDEAFEKGARVFNMSFAGPRDPLLLAMIDAAYAEGAIFVAAAGNNGPKAPPAFPAAYEKVIAITATDEGDHLYSHANHGDYITAAAPGVDILVPVTGEGFDYLSGTSFAAAHVSGIIALIMERNPDMTADTVREVLTRGAHSLGAKDFGAGLADAYASLLLAGGK